MDRIHFQLVNICQQGVVDILISDYSSVFFDFIPTEKPIIHYVYDIEEYTAIRGLNLTKDELPGYIAENIEASIFSAI